MHATAPTLHRTHTPPLGSSVHFADMQQVLVDMLAIDAETDAQWMEAMAKHGQDFTAAYVESTKTANKFVRD